MCVARIWVDIPFLPTFTLYAHWMNAADNQMATYFTHVIWVVATTTKTTITPTTEKCLSEERWLVAAPLTEFCVFLLETNFINYAARMWCLPVRLPSVCPFTVCARTHFQTATPVNDNATRARYFHHRCYFDTGISWALPVQQRCRACKLHRVEIMIIHVYVCMNVKTMISLPHIQIRKTNFSFTALTTHGE